MHLRATALLAAACLIAVPATGLADLSTYSQDFEGLVQSDLSALSGDGWVVWGNVFDGDLLYSYGVFPAPNTGGSAFSAIDTGQGGPAQGSQQLSVYNDYDNVLSHSSGHVIEANVFQEQTVGAADVGKQWIFEFDAKLGNLEGSSSAAAFIKTVDPGAGFALTNLLTEDMTSAPTTWTAYSISITIDASLVGQLLQFGFLNGATNFEGAGVFYDNVEFRMGPPVSLEDKSWAGTKALYR
jgi:hypothetical protein